MKGLFVMVVALVFAEAIGSYGEAPSAEASPQSYDVYSAFLRSELAGHNGTDNLRLGKGAVVLAPVTLTFSATSSPQWDLVRLENKGLQSSTFEAFQQCQADSLSISRSFSVDAWYEVASREEITTVKNFVTQYPDNRCLIQFSCVGFNPGEMQAFFVVERSMCHSGIQKYVVMKKGSNGRWIVESQAVGWIQ
jgi:hypothetical protein